MADPVGPALIVEQLRGRGWTLATGESLTAGLVAATLADVPGCSAVLRGGVIAYAADVKHEVLAVPAAALAAGLVSRDVALALATGAARVLRAEVGIGTTGVAGPDAHDGVDVGTVWVAVSTPNGSAARRLALTGDRGEIRCRTVAACWQLLGGMLDPAVTEQAAVTERPPVRE